MVIWREGWAPPGVQPFSRRPVRGIVHNSRRVPEVAGIVLAAGKGTRMKSAKPKVLHDVCGIPMVEHVLRALRCANVHRVVCVIGCGAEEVSRALEGSAEFALQEVQRGSGDACRVGMEALGAFEGTVVVAPGDAPLVTDEVFMAMVAAIEAGAEGALATCVMEDPTGYGRILRSEAGDVLAVVEEVDATAEQRSIREVCTSFYAFRVSALREALPLLKADNAKGELYLTDVVETLVGLGCRVVAVPISDGSLLMGVNDRWQLAGASEHMRRRVLKSLALEGVTIEDLGTTFVEVDVRVEQDTVLHPMTILRGRTRVGAGCEIGPFARIEDSEIAEGTVILMSHVQRAVIGRGCRVGPFANLRPGCRLGEGVKVGNFVEAKNAELCDGASAAHLSYLGDAVVGKGTNIGAGTITCNYDGFEKHTTTIGENAFIGSNSTLVAPVSIGDGAIIAAGSVITQDVPSNAMAVARERQVNKEEYAERWRRRKQSKSNE